MTEGELWEMMLAVAGNATSAFAGLTTMVFAYLAAAYMVGSRLTRFQALVVSSFFVFFATIATAGLYGTLARGIDFAARLQKIHPDKRLLMDEALVYPLLALCALTIPTSLFFMYQIRKKPKIGASGS
ncbi:MAG: hypothetical protein AMJ63_04175 [Myxococcales bacterium SG8_38_1]|jgi:hypothetical protein|nr:MAG: hypothetical protein AMJ63_04175 [Myxococcales bacterium SG8_38_1]